tara:strand:+ start:262 stop:474 length:213 start_codon:yes stop_codon:yes gene_type:complete
MFGEKQSQDFEARASTAIEMMSQASVKMLRAAVKGVLHEEQHRAIVIAIEAAAREVRRLPVVKDKEPDRG